MLTNFRSSILTGVTGVTLGLGLGWWLWHPDAAIAEPPAFAQRQADSSLILERRPDAAAKPKQLLPTGAVVERVASVTVQPRAFAVPVQNVPRETMQDVVRSAIASETRRDTVISSTAIISAGADSVRCPAVTVDLTLIRMPDQTRRVVASSPDGLVVGGVDVPVESATVPKVLRWSAGVTYDPGTKHYGAALARDVGPLRLGGIIIADPGAPRVALVAMLRF